MDMHDAEGPQQLSARLPIRPALTARRHVDLARVSSAICPA